MTENHPPVRERSDTRPSGPRWKPSCMQHRALACRAAELRVTGSQGHRVTECIVAAVAGLQSSGSHSAEQAYRRYGEDGTCFLGPSSSAVLMLLRTQGARPAQHEQGAQAQALAKGTLTCPCSAADPQSPSSQLSSGCHHSVSPLRSWGTEGSNGLITLRHAMQCTLQL